MLGLMNMVLIWMAQTLQINDVYSHRHGPYTRKSAVGGHENFPCRHTRASHLEVAVSSLDGAAARLRNDNCVLVRICLL